MPPSQAEATPDSGMVLDHTASTDTTSDVHPDKESGVVSRVKKYGLRDSLGWQEIGRDPRGRNPR
jgi:hypothetical protein